jgi:hypothetical protein
MSYIILSFFLLLGLCQETEAARKAKASSRKSRARAAPDTVKVARHRLEAVNTVSDSGFTHLLLVFDSGVPAYKVKMGKHQGIHVYSLRLASTDYEALTIPITDRPLYHVEAIKGFNLDTLEVYLHLYLEDKVKPEVIKAEDKLKLKFPGADLPEDVWPFRTEKVDYLSADPFNLIVKLEFDNLPSMRKIFLTKNKSSLVVLFINTIMDTSRISDPAVPFVNNFRVIHRITDNGVNYSKFILGSNFAMAFSIREDNYRIFINLQKEAVRANPRWFE